MALAGRPNAGKSTLLNAVVGGPVAIVSDRPQTTRRAIRGIRTEEGSQLILVDLPGVQRPRDPMTERMQRRVERELADSDAVLLVLNGEQAVGPGDRFIARSIRSVGLPAVTAVNKIDLIDRARTLAALEAAAELEVQGGIFPVSARTGQGVPELVEELTGLLPEGPFLFPAGETSDQRREVRVAELIREQVLLRTREELPHAVEVEVSEIAEREDGLTTVEAAVWAESESQKAILIGSGGRMVKAVGTAARERLEDELERRVHLELKVRVRRGWRRDEALLDRLGIE